MSPVDPFLAARPVFWLGLLWLAVTPLAAQTMPSADSQANPPQPCRSARAVHDTSCPNYTGYSHPLATDAGPSRASGLGLRSGALESNPLDDAAAQPRLKKGPVIERGLASWYGDRHHGARTASGEVFSKRDFTAAHKTLPFGTRVLVRNPRTGREVVVRITDRGPYSRNRVIDVSKAAAEALGMIARGHDTVVLHALGRSMDGDAVGAAPASDPDGGF